MSHFQKKHVVVIDPAMRIPELACLNLLSLLSGLPTTYHLPALYGFASLKQETPATIAGIVVLGSLASVNERKDWQKELEAWLADRLHEQIPTLGICYGHQMIAAMFGARVAYVTSDQKKCLGFRKVSFDPDPLWGGNATEGELFVSHLEKVVDCPVDMKTIGRSSLIETDAFKHKQLPIWTFQSHPEATPDFLALRGSPAASPEQYRFGHSILQAFLDHAAEKK